MTDDRSPTDDQGTDDQPVDVLVSAVLDGEATPAERALVEGSPEGRRRLDELQAAAAAVAEAVPPMPGTTTDALIARALDAAAPSTVAETTAAGASVVAAGQVAARRRQRDLGHLWRRVGGAAAAVAAVAVLVAGIAALAQTGGRSSSDSASSATADTADGSGAAESGQAADQAAPTDESYESASGTAALPDLGTLVDAEALLDRYVVLRSGQPSTDHQFDPTTTSVGADAATDEGSSTEAAPRATAACPVPPVMVAAGENWTVTATAQLPGGPVLIMGNGLASPTNRVLVVDATTCTVLAERVI